MTIAVTSELRFVNVGEDPPTADPVYWVGRRQWSACVAYNFVSAGQHPKYSRPLKKLIKGDIIAAFISGLGYVGIGIIEEEAVPITSFLFAGKTFADLTIDARFISGKLINNETVPQLPFLRKTLFRNAGNEDAEYVARVHWLKTVSRENAYWKRRSGLFANPSIQCSLRKQPRTIRFLEESFNVKIVWPNNQFRS